MEAETMKKLTKTQAKKAWLEGENVYFVPCKISIAAPQSWMICKNKTECDYIKTEEIDGKIVVLKCSAEESFERLCNEIWYYNCNSETGKYLHYFI